MIAGRKSSDPGRTGEAVPLVQLPMACDNTGSITRPGM
jgi:hypothetical protein